MKSYSQNREDVFVSEYFGDRQGVLLEIGANDGATLSNSKLLIEQGWTAHLVEPAGVYNDLRRLYLDNPFVNCYNLAIGKETNVLTFYESGAHVAGGSDKALVSTLDFEETKRWTSAGVKFDTVKVNVVPFNYFWELAGFPQFDFISIDAEGFDWIILQQIDLRAVGCKCLCIEYNSDPRLKLLFMQYCERFGMSLSVMNAENLIFTI